MEREGKDGKIAEEVFEIGDGVGGEDARIHGEGGVAERETKD